MPVALGRRYVAAPPFAPLRFGLLSVADQPLDPDPHWQAGVEFQPDACDAASATRDGCPAGDTPTKAPTTEEVGTVGIEPFTVYSMIDCSPVGVYDEFERRTVSALRNGAGRAVEAVFWTGVAGPDTVYPHLAANSVVVSGGSQVQSAATVVVTGSPDIVEALGALEGALASCYGGEGVIHVPAAAGAHLAAHGLVVRDGERLRTSVIGNRVAVYSSNNRQGPTGADPAAGNAWFYATGAVSARRGEVVVTSRLNDALDRSNNTFRLVAEQTFVVGWDCCHLAVQVALSGVA